MRKKTWEKNQYIYYFADKQNIQMQKGSSPYLYITSTVCLEFAQNMQYLNHFITKAYEQQALKKTSFQMHPWYTGILNYSLTVIFPYDTFIYFRYFFSTKFFFKT